ncbi:MAG: DNA polymerase Y family protein, partial [Actinomycetes bacterium]
MHVNAGTTRQLSVWCADWPVVALERPSHLPVAVIRSHRVVAVGPVARADGVVPGLRRREAQTRCPQVELHTADPARDARVFEVVLSAMEQVAPHVELGPPGRCAIPVTGAARLHGGERGLAAAVLQHVQRALVDGPGGGRVPCAVGVGVADGPRAAALAAETAVDRNGGRSPLVVPAGESGKFLAPLDVRRLHPDPADPTCATLRRLGVRTVARFAALPAADVLERFGVDGWALHRIATGTEDWSPELVEPPSEMSVAVDLDPPLDRIDQAAFVVKSLAHELLVALAAQSLLAARFLVTVVTEGGAVLERSWRHEGALTAAAVAQRVRWQLDGWLRTGVGATGALGPVVRLEVRPEGLRPTGGTQLE